MNLKSPLALVFAGLLLIGAGSSFMLLSAKPDSAELKLMGVRAEFVDLDGNHWHMETTCHLINRNLGQPIVLREILILGPGGRQDVIAKYGGLNGTVVEPLGEVRLNIDSNIPGVLPQTTVDAHGVRNVIVAWEGPDGALNLTAVLERYPPSNDIHRAHVVARGYEVTL